MNLETSEFVISDSHDSPRRKEIRLERWGEWSYVIWDFAEFSRGTFAFCAPELYFGKLYTAASDIYSYSIVLWELLHRTITGQYARPYGEFPQISNEMQIIIQVTLWHLYVSLTPERQTDIFDRCQRRI